MGERSELKSGEAGAAGCRADLGEVDPSDVEAVGVAVTVREYMTPRVLAVRADCAVSVAMDTIMVSGLRHLVVVDPDGRFLGLLPAELVSSSVLGHLTRPRRIVADLIPPHPVHVAPATTMHAAASAMLDEQVDAVAVLESGGRLVGVLSWSDIVRMVANTPDPGMSRPGPGTVRGRAVVVPTDSYRP
jgi:CBS domain-containing protein